MFVTFLLQHRFVALILIHSVAAKGNHEMIQIIEMFETTDRFVKQTPHTLYVTLEKLND